MSNSTVVYIFLGLVLLSREVQPDRVKAPHSKASFLGKDVVPSFEDFMSTHGRTYKVGSEEYAMRQALFQRRVDEVLAHNSKGLRWKAAVNKLADRTLEELQGLRGWNGAARSEGPSNAQRPHVVGLSEATKAEPPSCVDWTHLQSLQNENLLDQQSCGSCWAFAAAKVLEAHSEIYSERRTFSTEQIVSCSKNPKHCGGTGGCEGATAEIAFEYVLGVGCETNEKIPYAGTEAICKTQKYQDLGPYSTMTLSADSSEVHNPSPSFLAIGGHDSGGASFGMTGWMKLPENKLDALKVALASHGPVAVSVSAANGWNFYSSGIMTPESCPKDAIIDHAVTLVGYGTDGSDKYWRILNSWGKTWGENGYIRMAMSDNDEDYCGMDDQPQLGTACSGETDPVRVCGMCGILYDTSLPIFNGNNSAMQAKALQCE